VTIYDLKPAFQNRLRPVVETLATKGITPNQVTLAALILSLVTGMLMSTFPTVRVVYLLLPVVLFVRMALNAIDGMLASEYDQKTKLGTFLNELSDVASDAALYLPFAVITPVLAIVVMLIVVLAGLSEMAGVVAVMVGSARRYDGPMGKSDRAFVFGVLALLLTFWQIPLWLLAGVYMVVLLLLGVTVVNRVRGSLNAPVNANSVKANGVGVDGVDARAANAQHVDANDVHTDGANHAR
jgi:CDP-diacylglycerol--glycerol-3-phosphate 3-phosphatidyltransferase